MVCVYIFKYIHVTTVNIFKVGGVLIYISTTLIKENLEINHN